MLVNLKEEEEKKKYLFSRIEEISLFKKNKKGRKETDDLCDIITYDIDTLNLSDYIHTYIYMLKNINFF